MELIVPRLLGALVRFNLGMPDKSGIQTIIRSYVCTPVKIESPQARFCESHRPVHIAETAIGRPSCKSCKSFIHSFSTDSVEKLAGDFAEGLARL